jgi:hypothetical protein
MNFPRPQGIWNPKKASLERSRQIDASLSFLENMQSKRQWRFIKPHFMRWSASGLGLGALQLS